MCLPLLHMKKGEKSQFYRWVFNTYMEEKNRILPIVALRGLTILPEMVKHFDVSRDKTMKAVEKAIEENQKVFFVSQKDPAKEDPKEEDLYKIGCIGVVKQVVKLSRKMTRVLVVGEERARLLELETETEYFSGKVEAIPDEYFGKDGELLERTILEEAMLGGAKDIFREYMLKDPKLSKELSTQIDNIGELTQMIDMIAANVPFDFTDAQQLLEAYNVGERYELLIDKMVRHLQILSIKEELQNKVKERMDKHQKEYVLREEMRLIREELGDDSTLTDAEEFQQRLEKLKAPVEVVEKLQKEIKRFKNSLNSPAETGVIRTYIETLLDMPWDRVVKEHKDIEYARKILDEDHYGLEPVKERVLEFLAVRALTKKGDSPILCLAGPPGTGKTSIAKSLAKALKKPYVRISLGGVRDEAEIRGHRRTYVGAMPGRLVAGLKQAGVKNPLMLLDEIDKVSNDYKGDTFSALLEVLDSEQNRKFRDHYMEVPVDLSEVLFITTANTLQTIPRPLLDRMEVIEISSYTENEKLHIAGRHLLPKQLSRHGLKAGQLLLSRAALGKIIRNYTKEAGVRQLERVIGNICRKAAKEILETGKKEIRISERNLEKYLGKEKFVYQMANTEDEVGIVRGLAWTSVGGDTLQIEVNVMPGSGEILLTGQLGDVMKESARTGISYIRSVGEAKGIADNFFKEHDIHIHIPEGAVPKDGPSAGITMATAMLSAITGKKVRADVAMTGEITLRGRVLPIGGLKEKLLAAKNAGIKTVLVPKENARDVNEIAAEITKGLEIRLVSQMDQVLEAAFAKEKE